jgi:opacity protein-like surface antigen
VVINIRKLSRFGDYNLDDLTGDLSFSDAIPTVDEKQNPVYIRASYDLDGNTEKYTVAGLRINHQVNKALNVGISHSYDDNETEGKKITGVSAEYKNKDTRITASAATLKHQSASKEDGKAVRLGVEQKWSASSKTNLIYGRADKNYDNQTGGVTADREELRIAHRQRVSKEVGVNVEAIHSKSLSEDSVQQSVGVTADVKTGKVTLKAGARHIKQKNSADNDSFNTVILGAKAPINLGKRKGNISAEYEQDIGNAERKRVAIGADLQVHEKVKIYTKAEQINSMSGISGLSTKNEQTTFSAGVKSNVLPSTEVYSEYRLRGTTDGRDLETASGIRGDYEIKKGLSVAPRMEIVKNIEGQGKDSVSLSVGVKDVRNKNQRKSGRVELRHDDDRDYVGLEGTYVARLNEEWSVLLRDSARFDWDRDKEDLQVNNTFSVGLSLRPHRDNKHNMLFLYENKLERGFDAEDDCNKHILSTHQSYQINESISISGRLGNKYEKCSNDGVDVSTNTTLADGRLIWDINKRFDADIHGGILATDGLRERQYSAGLGINYLVKQNMRVGAGYNIKGFEDDDLDSEGYNKQGVYVGMQYKFDEKNLGWLSGDKQQDRSRVEMPAESPAIPKIRVEDTGSKDTVKDIFGSWF